MDQINSSANRDDKISSDREKQEMQQAAAEFMALPEYQKRIKSMIGRQTRVNIDIDEVRKHNPNLSQYIRKNPIEAIKIFEDQLNLMVKGMKEDGGKGSEKTAAQSNDSAFPTKVKNYYVNFEGNFGKNYVTPRGLKANLVN